MLASLAMVTLAQDSPSAAPSVRPRQPAQAFLTEFRLDPLPEIAADPSAVKAAVAAFVNSLAVTNHPAYDSSNVTLTP